MSNKSEHCVNEQGNDHTKLIRAEKEFLTLREKLKAKFRKDMGKERAYLFGDTIISSPGTSKANFTNKNKDKYGSFFGPSLPSVATRVVEERIYMRAQSSASSQKKRTACSLSEKKNSASKKMKMAKQLRYTRDFSFLFTEDGNGTKMSTDSKSNDASSTQQTPPSKSSVAPSKDHRVEPTSRTDNPNVSHTAQRKRANHQRPAGSYKQSLSQCNKKTPASALPRIGRCQSEKRQDNKADRRARRPAKRPFDEEDDTDAIRIIRDMFKYDPSKWEGKEEEDISEVGFETIQREERRSARIAKNEDDEQLQIILEEEKRKKRKIRPN